MVVRVKYWFAPRMRTTEREADMAAAALDERGNMYMIRREREQRWMLPGRDKLEGCRNAT